MQAKTRQNANIWIFIYGNKSGDNSVNGNEVKSLRKTIEIQTDYLSWRCTIEYKVQDIGKTDQSWIKQKIRELFKLFKTEKMDIFL